MGWIKEKVILLIRCTLQEVRQGIIGDDVRVVGLCKSVGASNQYAEKAFMKMWIDSFAPKNLKVQDRKNIRLCIVFLMFRWRGLDVLTERCTDHLRFNISNGHLWTMDEA